MAPVPLQFFEINDQTAFIILCICESVYTLILMPISLYYSMELWELYKADKFIYIKKRRVHIVLITVFILNFYAIIVRSFTDLPTVWVAINVLDNFNVRIALVDCIHLIVSILCARLWLIYYDWRKGVQSLSRQWKKHILKQDDYIPWTIKKKWLGSNKIICTIVFITWIPTLCVIQLIHRQLLFANKTPIICIQNIINYICLIITLK